MINEIRAVFHRIITDAIRRGEIKLVKEDIRDLASDTSSLLATKLASPSTSNEEKKRAANGLVAISSVEDDLSGY